MSSVISSRIGRAEPTAQQLLLERLDEVLGLVLLDLDVLVARHAEDVVLDDLHAGEEVLEVVGDEVLERDPPGVLDGLVGVDLHEARAASAAPSRVRTPDATCGCCARAPRG
jgi:hypothetical protein